MIDRAAPHLASLGISDDRITLLPYCSEWPIMFEREAARIREACGDWIVDMEHIGSTAVPGLMAKPILDIMPGLAAIEHAAHCIKPMQELGYEHLGEYGIPGRAHFVLRHEGRRVVHVHMYERACHDWNRHLAFRNVLRADASKREAYAALKQQLAEMFGSNDARERYAQGKCDFIRAMLIE